MIVSIPTPLLKRIVIVVAALVLVSSLTIIGIDRLRRLRADLRSRLGDVYPYIGLVAAVMIANSYVRDRGQTLSWLLDWQITGLIFAIEGGLVADIQSFATEELTAFFSVIYIYGYVFLLVFPFLAYLAKEDLSSFRQLMIAYSINYTIGVICYVLFIAYGPRNLLYPQVESLMYVHWPQSQILTGEINSNTNVFPSLHSSISMTVVFFAYRTRRTYPAWLAVSTPLAITVLVSTMYLGIHWGVDVAAGVALAGLSVLAATRLTDDDGQNVWLVGVARRLVAFLYYPIRVARHWLSGSQSRDVDNQSR